MTIPNSPAAPAFTPDSASSTTAQASVGRPSSSAARSNMSGSGLPGMPSRAATAPSTTTSKRSARPAAASTEGAFFELETTAMLAPARVTASSSATLPG